MTPLKRGSPSSPAPGPSLRGADGVPGSLVLCPSCRESRGSPRSLRERSGVPFPVSGLSPLLAQWPASPQKLAFFAWGRHVLLFQEGCWRGSRTWRRSQAVAGGGRGITSIPSGQGERGDSSGQPPSTSDFSAHLSRSSPRCLPREGSRPRLCSVSEVSSSCFGGQRRPS